MLTQDDVLYMIVTDRFSDGDPTNNRDPDPRHPEQRHGGDLRGIISRMPYLVDLGVTTVWITPVYPNPPAGYHGYHPLDFDGVDPALCSPELGPDGSRETVRRFVQAAHRHGLKVMLDLIVCHTAPGHPWLIERPEWFNPNQNTPEKWWVWGLPDLNHDRLDVNEYFARNVLDWIGETGADAIRLDAARHIEAAFWPVFQLLVRGPHPDVTVVGEVWDPDANVVAPYQTRHGFDSMFDFPLYHALVDVFAGDAGCEFLARPELSDSEAPGVLNRDNLYRNPNQLVTFLGNHDTTRFFHLAGGEERPDEAMARMRLALTFLFTTRGIPHLYYGDELAMEGGPHPDNRRDMPWERVNAPDSADPATCRAAVMRRHAQSLIYTRRRSPALRYGLSTTLYVTRTLFAFCRAFLDDVRIVVLNPADARAEFLLPLHANPRLPTQARAVLHDGAELTDELSPHVRFGVTDGALRLSVPARSGLILRPT